MSSESEEIGEPKLLAVEGKDEENFFEAMIRHLSLSNIQIKDIAGKTKFASRLEALHKTSGFSQVESLGVIRDANDNPNGAFQSICAALQSAGLSVPNNPMQFSRGTPRVIVMILPDNTSPGMLEDLCLRAVESNQAMPCVNQYFECLGSEGITPTKLSKAKVQTFLASKPKTGIPLGIAAKKGYWPLDSDVFVQVMGFLRNL